MPGATIQLIVGLGNPGAEYAGTRHNVGFMIADRLAEGAGAPWKYERRWRTELARTPYAWLCKPQTYMNLSGEAVSSVCGFYKIPAASVLVLVDDLALPLGRLRLRENGSAGGHNGLKSLIEHFGTQNFPRLRVGIGGAQSGEVVGHVLGRFSPEERPVLAEALDRSVAAVQSAVTNGLPAAMNTFN